MPLYKCILPEIVDPNEGDSVSISSIKIHEDFIYLDVDKLIIYINQNKLQLKDVGTHTVTLTASDDKNA